MNSTPNKNYFTTGQMRNALIQIEDQMVHSGWMPSIVLGINRGGCIPGVYLSHRLNISHEVLDIRLRDHKVKPNLTVLEKVFAFQNKILIIDDINDTGDTFNILLKTLVWEMVELNLRHLLIINQVKQKLITKDTK